MVQQAEYRTSDTLPPEADLDKCEECDAPATLAYRWDWGKTGIVCAKHGALMQQKAVSLKRQVTVHPRQLAAPAPLGRDEKCKLVAEALVLKDELQAAQSAGQQLHAKNQDLQVQLSAGITKTRELKAQLEDQAKRTQAIEAERDRLSAQNGELLVELDRLKHLDALVSEQQSREAHERGIEGGNVVDG